MKTKNPQNADAVYQSSRTSTAGIWDLLDWIPFLMNLHEMNEMYGNSDFQFRFKEKCRSTVFSTGRSVALPFLGSIPASSGIIIIKKKAGLYL